MFNWLQGRGKTAAVSSHEAQTSRLEQKIELLEQTVRQLASETRKQSVVVRQLHIHHPVVENVTFRLDALDIEELSGSLNLGNNFDVQLDPEQLFRGSKDGKAKRGHTGGKSGSAGDSRHTDAGTAQSAHEDDSSFQRTSSGYSFRTASSSTSFREPAPNPDPPQTRKL
ncbi:hypothetical protein FE783_04290 [Paenibacillus mesophilus]|uniref:hypothetical protein n=1 Tax=Paenibacillus mesophilus TaxID=2582849 RepID=UPI00110EE8AD|nr:hypothetical protein [Paenibacillus mesophilus]TMV52170.1 hypothetical protein FE783_04290 [Paenibacillus mesophilus]